MHGKELKSPGNKVSTGLDYCKSGYLVREQCQ